MKNIVIFASGGGSNALKILEFYKNHASIKVSALFCNNQNAGALNHAKTYDIPIVVFDKDLLNNKDEFLSQISKYTPDLIVLAGFLWLVPEYLINEYPNKIINLHPALLPDFGGIGMYGKNVHVAVLASNKKVSGITIHYVNKHFDEGAFIFQTSCIIDKDESMESLKSKIQFLEHNYLPKVTEMCILENS